ncbi:hypothetical protein C8R46DRAFT_1274006 [Mycena filopes]|nr:hypothetical protein C8R46DRAFT_1274006 [Mycena filopes]
MQLRLSILFNAVFRVWTLRFLLGSMPFLIIWALLHQNFAWSLLTCLAIVHHFLAVLQWPITSSAIIDLVLTLLEFAGVLYIGHLLLQESDQTFNNIPWLPGSILMVITLMFSIIFRTATIAKSPEPFLRQHLEFLGGCTPLYPPYTPARILLNRSIARPLFRCDEISLHGLTTYY